MAHTEALICGPFAVNFFDRLQSHSSELSICVKQGPALESMLSYLSDAEGYAIQQTVNSSADGCLWWDSRPHWLAAEFTLMSTTAKHGDPSEPRILKIFSVLKFTSIGNIVVDSWNMSRLAFISWNRAYKLFPLMESSKEDAPPNSDDGPFASKTSRPTRYRSRGWMVLNPLGWQRIPHRWGGPLTWKIDLDTAEISPCAVLSYFDNQGFEVYKDENEVKNSPSVTEHIMTDPLYHPLLKRDYAATSEDFRRFVVEQKMHRLMRSQMLSLKPEDRPSYYTEAISRPMDWPFPYYKFRWDEPWQPPEYWVYHDDKLEEWWREYHNNGAAGEVSSNAVLERVEYANGS